MSKLLFMNCEESEYFEIFNWNFEILKPRDLDSLGALDIFRNRETEKFGLSNALKRQQISQIFSTVLFDYVYQLFVW